MNKKHHHLNPLKEIKKIMANIQKWLEDTLAAIVTIAKGDPDDQETKDKVDQLLLQMTELTDKLRDNDAADAGQKEAAEALKAAFDALVRQLAAVPPPVEPPVEP